MEGKVFADYITVSFKRQHAAKSKKSKVDLNSFDVLRNADSFIRRERHEAGLHAAAIVEHYANRGCARAR
jgi:hypothetical protein